MRLFPMTCARTRFRELCSVGIFALIGSHAAAEPDMLLVNAKVFTGDPMHPFAQAVAIEAGRILAVGGDERFARWPALRPTSSMLAVAWSRRV